MNDDLVVLKGGVTEIINYSDEENNRFTTLYRDRIIDRFYLPRYFTIPKYWGDIRSSINLESSLGYDKDSNNYFELRVAEYSNTENGVRDILSQYLPLFTQLGYGYEIEKAWKLPRNSSYERLVLGARIAFGRLEYNGKERVEKEGLDTTQIQKNLLNLQASLLTLDPNSPKKPIGVGAGTFMGGLLAGPVGAIVGYASSSAKNQKYETAVERAKRINSENEYKRAASEEKMTTLPTKAKTVNRHNFSYYFSWEHDIKVDFYIDETDEKIAIFYKGKEYNINDFIELAKPKMEFCRKEIDKQINLYKNHKIWIEDNDYAYAALKNIDVSKTKEEILNTILETLDGMVNNADDIWLLTQIEEEYEGKYGLKDYSPIEEYKSKLSAKRIQMLENQISRLRSQEECTKLIDEIERWDFIQEKDKYINQIKYINQQIIMKEEEGKNKQIQNRIEKIEEEIKWKEDYLESLYHGHRLTGLIVFMSVLIVISILVIIFAKTEFWRNYFVFFLVMGVVGLIIVINTGKPSSRPAIPKTKKEIDELYQELDALKRGKIPKGIDIINDSLEQVTATIEKGGWICPDCNKVNASYIGTCACGASKY